MTTDAAYMRQYRARRRQAAPVNLCPRCGSALPRSNARACCDACRVWMHRHPDTTADLPRVQHLAVGIDPEDLEEIHRDAWRVALAIEPVTRRAFEVLRNGGTIDRAAIDRENRQALQQAGFNVDPVQDLAVDPEPPAAADPPQDVDGQETRGDVVSRVKWFRKGVEVQPPPVLDYY